MKCVRGDWCGVFLYTKLHERKYNIVNQLTMNKITVTLTDVLEIVEKLLMLFFVRSLVVLQFAENVARASTKIST